MQRESEVAFSHLGRHANAHVAAATTGSGSGTCGAFSQPVTKCDFKA